MALCNFQALSIHKLKAIALRASPKAIDGVKSVKNDLKTH